jgi:hypothetical protein
MYLPLDKLIQGGDQNKTMREQQFTTQEGIRTQGGSGQIRNVDRTRGVR